MSNRGRLARRLVVGTTLLWCAVAAAAGGGAEAATASGEVVVLITDHREAIDDFSSLVVTVGGARLHQRARLPDEGWVMLETTPRQIDLTRYRDGATFELLRAEAPAARYDAADLLAEAMARGVVLVGDAGDSVGVPLDLSPARVDIAVRPDQVTQVTFDLVVHDLRDHPGKTWGVLLDEVRVVTMGSGTALGARRAAAPLSSTGRP